MTLHVIGFDGKYLDGGFTLPSSANLETLRIAVAAKTRVEEKSFNFRLNSKHASNELLCGDEGVTAGKLSMHVLQKQSAIVAAKSRMKLHKIQRSRVFRVA